MVDINKEELVRRTQEGVQLLTANASKRWVQSKKSAEEKLKSIAFRQEKLYQDLLIDIDGNHIDEALKKIIKSPKDEELDLEQETLKAQLKAQLKAEEKEKEKEMEEKADAQAYVNAMIHARAIVSVLKMPTMLEKLKSQYQNDTKTIGKIIAIADREEQEEQEALASVQELLKESSSGVLAELVQCEFQQLCDKRFFQSYGQKLLEHLDRDNHEKQELRKLIRSSMECNDIEPKPTMAPTSPVLSTKASEKVNKLIEENLVDKSYDQLSYFRKNIKELSEVSVKIGSKYATNQARINSKPLSSQTIVQTANECIKEQSSKKNPDGVYRGIGIDYELEEKSGVIGLKITDIFSPEDKRFSLGKGKKSNMQSNELEGQYIVSVQVKDPNSKTTYYKNISDFFKEAQTELNQDTQYNKLKPEEKEAKVKEKALVAISKEFRKEENEIKLGVQEEINPTSLATKITCKKRLFVTSDCDAVKGRIGDKVKGEKFNPKTHGTACIEGFAQKIHDLSLHQYHKEGR